MAMDDAAQVVLYIFVSQGMGGTDIMLLDVTLYVYIGYPILKSTTHYLQGLYFIVSFCRSHQATVFLAV